MAWPKGKPRLPEHRPPINKGRPKGVPNKGTVALREMILGALEGAGGEAYLMRQAEENPGPFMTLIGKVLPTQLTGADGGAIKHDVSLEARQEAAKALIDGVFGAADKT